MKHEKSIIHPGGHTIARGPSEEVGKLGSLSTGEMPLNVVSLIICVCVVVVGEGFIYTNF